MRDGENSSYGDFIRLEQSVQGEYWGENIKGKQTLLSKYP